MFRWTATIAPWRLRQSKQSVVIEARIGLLNLIASMHLILRDMQLMHEAPSTITWHFEFFCSRSTGKYTVRTVEFRKFSGPVK